MGTDTSLVAQGGQNIPKDDMKYLKKQNILTPLQINFEELDKLIKGYQICDMVIMWL